MKRSDHFILDFTLLWCWLCYFAQGDQIKFLESLADQTVRKGHKVSFTCSIGLNDDMEQENLRIRWKHNGEILDTRSDRFKVMDGGQTLVLREADYGDAGQYTCIASVRGQITEKEKSSAKLIVKGTPEPPQDVEISSCGPKRVELIWRDGLDGGEPIDEYLIQYNTSDNPYYWNSADEEIEYMDKVSKTAFVSLSPWGWYSFRVMAKNSLGYSEPSKPTKKECNTPPERPTSNPVNVKMKTDKEGKLIITWDPMPRMQHNAPSFGYRVSWRKRGSTFWNKKDIKNANENQFEVDVDDVYGLYDVQVQAFNSHGVSFMPVFTVRGHSGEGDPLIKPHDFRVDQTKDPQPHEAHFIWESVDPLDDGLRGKFRGYKLQYWKSSEGRRNKVEVPITIDPDTAHLSHDMRASISSLPANTAFRAQVSVMNGHHTGPPSDTIDFKTSEGVPGPVRNLQKDDVESDHVVLKWDPPDEPNGLLLGYDLGYQKLNGDVEGDIRALEPRINNPSHTSARITGLQPNHQYRFFVWARTSSGRGDKRGVQVLTKGPANSQMASIHQSGISLASHVLGVNCTVLMALAISWTMAKLVFH
ncbi:neuroglian-like [Saccostrea echinata]|uniref:neuroglian-like n=1 Tax=Saccostrea echinata TaxID=191078 RepID=UPI002A7FBEA8|nr:neuroglian-like [Saccostrea echinata]